MMKRLLFTAVYFLLILSACSSRSDLISGRVVDETGNQVAGAVVRVQTTESFTISDESGKFVLTKIPDKQDLFITAWKSGYFIAGVAAKPGDNALEIEIHAHASIDNRDYAWLPSEYHPGEGEHQGCAACHSHVGTQDSTPLPVDQWLLDAHSQSAKNPRFISMYNGTDIQGNQSP